MDVGAFTTKASVSLMKNAAVDFSAFCQEMGALYGLEFGSCDWDIYDHDNGCAVTFWNADGAQFRFTGPDIQTVLDLTRVEIDHYFREQNRGD